MKRLYVTFVLALLFGGGLVAQNSLPFNPGRQAFALPNGVLPADCVPNALVFRVQDRYRTWCGPNKVEIPGFEKYLDALQVGRIHRAFPNQMPPDQAYDQLGRKLADLSLIYELEFQANADLVEATNFLLGAGIFEYVEPIYLYQSFYTPSDPEVSAQYYLDLINAQQAWDLNKGDSTVVIGIVDTGTSFSHPDLVNKHKLNLNDPIDGLDNDNDGYIDNYQGWDMAGDVWLSPGDNDPSWGGTGAGIDHGVLVSGPAAADTDNGYGIAGVGFNCRLLPVKVSIDFSPLIYRGYQGLVYAADHGAQIINLSWGGSANSRMGRDAVAYATVNKEALVVAACGNTPAFIDFFPASFPNVLSVAGSQQNDAVWNSTSTFGTTYHYMVDIVAPSRDVRTISSNNGLFSATGTSLGAPIVCGAAGLVKSMFPGYSNAQVGEKVRVTSDQTFYNGNPGLYTEKLGRGRVDAHAALTQASPSVRAVDWEITDPKDGIVQAGDTVEVRIRFANYLDSVGNLSVNLATPNGTVFNILHGQVDLGNLGTLDTASNWLAPFKLVVSAGASPGYEGYLRLGYAGTGYTDWEYIPLIVEPDYVNIDQNRIEVSFDGKGRWGYMNYPTLTQGKGWTVDGVAGLMNDAGFLVGSSATQVSDNIQNQNGTANNHFENLNPIERFQPGFHSDVEANTRFNDAGAAANALDIEVDQQSYQFQLSPDDNYIIQEYTISNVHPTDTLRDGYAGMYFDLDGYWRTNNVSKYDSAARCIYNFTETWVTLWNMGIALLTPDSLHGYAAEVGTFGYTAADKWTALTSPPTAANLNNVNLVQFISAGPFDIAPGDSHVVAFALLAADSVAHLRSTAERANDKYWCVIRGGITNQTDLGPDFSHCGDTTIALDAGSGFMHYEWSNGDTTQTISVDSSGTYWVKTWSNSGCYDYDQIDISIGAEFNPGFDCSPQQIFVGDTVSFTDTTANAIEWGWDFGDGSSSCPIFPQTSHIYTVPGTYQVQMMVGNGTCTDTIVKQLQVDTLVSILSPASIEFALYPNPASEQVRLSWTAETGQRYGLRVYNLQGQMVQEKTEIEGVGTIEKILDCTSLPSGLYLVEIRSGQQRATKPLVLE